MIAGVDPTRGPLSELAIRVVRSVVPFDASDSWDFSVDQTATREITSTAANASFFISTTFATTPIVDTRGEGVVELTPKKDCDAYFATHPVDAQIGAWASSQSEPIQSRAALVAKIEEQARRFGVTLDERRGVEIPRPPHWGGLTLVYWYRP